MPKIASSLPLVVLLLSVCGCAQRMVRGIVDDGGRPVPNARLTLVGLDTTLTTKEDGSYEYSLSDWVLKKSGLKMRIAAAGHRAAIITFVADEAEGVHIPLRLLDTATPCAVGGILFGEVHDNEGKPIIGAVIRLAGTRCGGFSKAPDGRFFISKVPLGPHEIQMTAPGYEKRVRSVVIDSAHAQWLTFTSDTTRVQGCPIFQPRPSIPREQAATVRSIRAEDLNRSAHTSIFGSAAP